MSFDDGDHWQSLQLNLPAVSVRDLVVHGDDLVIATHGRGFWILDNITPLRQTDARGRGHPVQARDGDPAESRRLLRHAVPAGGAAGEKPALGRRDRLLLEIAAGGSDARDRRFEGRWCARIRARTRRRRAGAARRRSRTSGSRRPMRLTTHAGMNRFAWDLQYKDGPLVAPGTYQVRLTAGGKTYTQPLVVKMDPRSTATPAELTKQFDFSMQCAKAIGASRRNAASLSATEDRTRGSAKRRPHPARRIHPI